MTSASELLAGARLVVLKVGSSLVAAGDVFEEEGLAEDLSDWPGPLILVSSGAVALGHRALPELSGATLPGRQALSSIGQPLLMRAWEKAIGKDAVRTAQVLLTPDVTDDPVRADNARATLNCLLAENLIPIVNENDAVATEELRYGDNDRLAAQAAVLAGADLLVLLSDVDGCYDRNPKEDPGAMHFGTVPPEVLADPAGSIAAEKSALGSGGMRSKIEAAGIAVRAGIPAIIASGHGPRPLAALKAGRARASLALPG